MNLLLVVFVVCFCYCLAATYIPIIDENYSDCGHSGYLNLSGFEFHAHNDTVNFYFLSIFDELGYLTCYFLQSAHLSEWKNKVQ